MKTYHNRKYQMLCPKSNIVLLKNHNRELNEQKTNHQSTAISLQLRIDNAQTILDLLRKDLFEHFNLITNYNFDHRKFLFIDASRVFGMPMVKFKL